MFTIIISYFFKEMKKQHFILAVALICMLLGVVHFYMRGKNVSKYSALNLDHGRSQERVEDHVEAEERRYIQEGNPFDLGAAKIEIQPTTVRQTTTTTPTTKKTTVQPRPKETNKSIDKEENPANQKTGNSKSSEITLPNTDQIKKLETTLEKIKGLSLPVLKANLSKQLEESKLKEKSAATSKHNEQKPLMSDVRIYNWNGSWSLSPMCKGVKVNDFQEATLNTLSGQTPIFVYSETQDKYVSHDIIQTGRWEHHLAVPMVQLLQEDPSLTFLDIGANIGAFTLEMAKLGRKTIAVEPLIDNIKRLCCSVHKGKLGDLVTIVANAISSRHMQVTLGKDLDNVGGTFVNQDNPVKKAQIVMNGEYANPVNTILLDDILGLPDKPSRVVIKMDVEGYEHFVLEGGTYFFKQVFVKAVFMEWTYSNNPSIRDSIIKFMVNRNFLPHALSTQDSLLESSYDSWPGNIVWINKSEK